MKQTLGGRFGLGTVCAFVSGAKKLSTKYAFLTERKGYGGGKSKSEAYWKALGKQAK